MELNYTGIWYIIVISFEDSFGRTPTFNKNAKLNCILQQKHIYIDRLIHTHTHSLKFNSI